MLPNRSHRLAAFFIRIQRIPGCTVIEGFFYLFGSRVSGVILPAAMRGDWDADMRTVLGHQYRRKSNHIFWSRLFPVSI